MKSTREKIIAIIGPTASGKSELAVKIAKRFNGEIISADSRQVYKGMDIGTGKVSGNWNIIGGSLTPKGSRTSKVFTYKNVPHHCIDFVSPQRVFTVAEFKKCAKRAIEDITKRGKVPILCGGTGFYLDAVLYNLPIPNIQPNKKLRNKLAKKSAEDLFRMLKKLNPTRARTIDRHNPARLIRAIEIAKSGAGLANKGRFWEYLNKPNYHALILGIKLPRNVLFEKIDKRLNQRLRNGMIQEVKKLLKIGVSHKRLQDLGLEYRFISLYLQGRLSKVEMAEKLKTDIHQYSKRQMTWFKRNKDIRWITSEKMAFSSIKKFIAEK